MKLHLNPVYGNKITFLATTYDAASDLETYTHEDAVYRRLWLTVVLRAVEEAEGVNCLTDRRTTKLGLKRAARKWLRHDTPELRYVCMLAGVDVDKLLAMYGGKYATGKRNDAK